MHETALSLKETRDAVEAALSARFADVGFDLIVGETEYGPLLTVRWSDGPTARQVEEQCEPFGRTRKPEEYVDPDGPVETVVVGDDGAPHRVVSGIAWCSCKRTYTPGFLMQVVADVAAQWGETPLTVEMGDTGAYTPLRELALPNVNYTRAVWTEADQRSA